MGGLQHAAEAVQDGAQPPGTPPQRLRAFEALLGGGGPHLAVDVPEQRLVSAGGLAQEEGQDLVQAPPVEIGVQVPQARRQAASHLAVGRGVLAPGQPPPAVAQAEQGVELLDQLERQPPAPDRPDGDSVAGRRIGGHLQDRERDVQAAADVDQPIVAPGQPLVAGRLELLDQPVLEDERAQLGAGGPVVHDGGMARPGRRRRRRGEVRAGPAADRHGLADVEHPPGVVAEQVDARVAGQVGEVGLRSTPRGTRTGPPQARGAPRCGRQQAGWEGPGRGPFAGPPARREHRQGVADRGGVRAQPRE